MIYDRSIKNNKLGNFHLWLFVETDCFILSNSWAIWRLSDWSVNCHMGGLLFEVSGRAFVLSRGHTEQLRAPASHSTAMPSNQTAEQPPDNAFDGGVR